jgi:hypothetical protein
VCTVYQINNEQKLLCDRKWLKIKYTLLRTAYNNECVKNYCQQEKVCEWEARKTCHDSWWSGWDSNHIPPEYKSSVLWLHQSENGL